MTRAIMLTSSALLVAYGGACLFVPVRFAAALQLSEGAAVMLPMVAAGAFGLGAVNWVGRGAIYGGIYGKPIVLGNFTNAAITTLTWGSLVLDRPSALGWTITVLFLLSWVAFTRLLFWPPFGHSQDARR